MIDSGWKCAPGLFKSMEVWTRTVTWPLPPGQDVIEAKAAEIRADWQCKQQGGRAHISNNLHGSVTLQIVADVDSGG